MSHLVIPRNILCRQHRADTGKSQRLGPVDVHHSGPGIRRADRASVDHVLHFHIIHILAVSQHLLTHIHPVGSLSHTGDLLRLQIFHVLPQELRRQFHRVNNLLIPGTAADIVAESRRNLRSVRIQVDIQQPLGTHHHARDAEAALHGPRLTKGIDKHFLFPLRQSFHGNDRLSFKSGHFLDTGFCRFPIHQHGTGAAGAFAAAILHRF